MLIWQYICLLTKDAVYEFEEKDSTCSILFKFQGFNLENFSYSNNIPHQNLYKFSTKPPEPWNNFKVCKGPFKKYVTQGGRVGVRYFRSIFPWN